MKKYDELKKAIADGKFKKHIGAARLARMFFDLDKDEVETLATELKASVVCDGIIDEETKGILLEACAEVLAEKLIADKVFDYTSKVNSFDDLLGAIKDMI